MVDVWDPHLKRNGAKFKGNTNHNEHHK